MLTNLFKRTITLDEKMFTELCKEIEKELRLEIAKEYRDRIKAIDFNSYKIKVECSNLERKYIELQEAYDILQAQYEMLKKGSRQKDGILKGTVSTLAEEIFGTDV